MNLVKCAGRIAHKRERAKDQEGEIKKEKERVRQNDWMEWRNKSLLSRISIPAVVAVNHNQGVKKWKIKKCLNSTKKVEEEKEGMEKIKEKVLEGKVK